VESKRTGNTAPIILAVPAFRRALAHGATLAAAPLGPTSVHHLFSLAPSRRGGVDPARHMIAAVTEEQRVEIGRCDRCGASGPAVVTRHVSDAGKVTEKRACTDQTACKQRQAVTSVPPQPPD
jgi:phage-related protein